MPKLCALETDRKMSALAMHGEGIVDVAHRARRTARLARGDLRFEFAALGAFADNGEDNAGVVQQAGRVDQGLEAPCS